MVKKVVVAGCREYNDYREASEFISDCIKDIREKYTLVFVSGGCRGADKLGEKYAKENGFKTEVYMAEWDRYGMRAGPIRNEKMAEKSDYIICFWDGKSKGTKSMIDIALRMEKPIKIKKIYL